VIDQRGSDPAVDAQPVLTGVESTPPDAVKVTVITTFFNQREHVEGALDSIAAQTFTDYELIITDDCSEDGGPEAIEAWVEDRGTKAHLIINAHNEGLPASLNHALEQATGDYVVVLNGDDLMEPERLAIQVGAFDSMGEEVGGVYSQVRYMDGRGIDLGVIRPGLDEIEDGSIFPQVVLRNPIHTPALMVRRSTYDVIGLYDESFIADDYDLLLRLTEQFRVVCVPGVVTRYRHHPASMTWARAPELLEDRIRALQGRDPEGLALRALINARVISLAITLNDAGTNRPLARSLLLRALVRHPSLSVARALTENLLHLPPGSLRPLGRLRRR
jgi:glycosyltransferase involved in cell wall biosynthesis